MSCECDYPKVYVTKGSQAEVVTYDQTPRLGPTEVINAVTTVDPVEATTGIEVSNQQPNSEEFDDEDIEVGKAVQFQVNAVEVGAYLLKTTFTTDATPTRTLTDRIEVIVVE